MRARAQLSTLGRTRASEAKLFGNGGATAGSLVGRKSRGAGSSIMPNSSAMEVLPPEVSWGGSLVGLQHQQHQQQQRQQTFEQQQPVSEQVQRKIKGDVHVCIYVYLHLYACIYICIYSRRDAYLGCGECGRDMCASV